MHAIQVYVDETLDTQGLNNVKSALLKIPYVKDVIVSNHQPHDVVIEYDESDRSTPIKIMESLHHQGLHPDIISA
ncbi:MAG: hypothetical protein ACN4GM_04830 [Gammaproteobacteria bacterium]